MLAAIGPQPAELGSYRGHPGDVNKAVHPADAPWAALGQRDSIGPGLDSPHAQLTRQYRPAGLCGGVWLIRDDRVDLELHQPLWIDEARHLDEGAGGPYLGESLRVGAGRLPPLPDVSEHHPGPDHVSQ